MNPSETREPTELAAGEPTRPSRRSFRRRLRACLISTCCISAVLFGIFHRPLLFENLAVVDARVIRSAQPADHLEDWIHEYHLASILNLRGGTPADSWYANEAKTAAENHVAFFDYPMIATRRPLRRDLLTLIDFLRSSPYPLLVHCKQGADRTGLAVALYRMVGLNEPPEEAMGAFTIFHGHVPIAGTQRLHEPLDEYAAWLKASGLAHTAERFRDWVRDQYVSNDPPADPRPLASGPRPLNRQ